MAYFSIYIIYISITYFLVCCVLMMVILTDQNDPLSLKPNPDNFADNVGASSSVFVGIIIM